MHDDVSAKESEGDGVMRIGEQRVRAGGYLGSKYFLHLIQCARKLWLLEYWCGGWDKNWCGSSDCDPEIQGQSCLGFSDPRSEPANKAKSVFSPSTPMIEDSPLKA